MLPLRPQGRLCVPASLACSDKNSLLLVTKRTHHPPKLHPDKGPHTYTFEVEENIVADWKYTSSHYESHPRSLAQAPAHKPHPSRGLPLPNNPWSIFRLKFFWFLFDYTDARPSLLPKLEDEKCPGVSFSNCTWAAWVICCHQIDARNTSNEQTLNLNSGWLGRHRKLRQEEAILIESIFTVCQWCVRVCHCF